MPSTVKNVAVKCGFIRNYALWFCKVVFSRLKASLDQQHFESEISKGTFSKARSFH